MKLQFSVVYSINKQEAFNRYSNGIEVNLLDEEPALDKHSKLLLATVTAHNQLPQLVKATGEITINDVCFHCVVRLN